MIYAARTRRTLVLELALLDVEQVPPRVALHLEGDVPVAFMDWCVSSKVG